MCVCAAKNSDFALADDAVVIDLSDLNTVTVDVKGKVLSTRLLSNSANVDFEVKGNIFILNLLIRDLPFFLFLTTCSSQQCSHRFHFHYITSTK